MSTVLLETIRPGVTLLTLNRPDRLNAMSAELVATSTPASTRSPPIRTAGW